MKIAILGPGGVGGLIASLLSSKGHEVLCVTSNESAKIITEKGLHVKSRMFGEITAHPKASSALEETPDVMFVTVKATMLDDAIKKAEKKIVNDAIVIPLLNGFEPLDTLRKAYGDNVVAGNISVEAMRTSPNEIIHTSPFVKIRLATNNKTNNKNKKNKQNSDNATESEIAKKIEAIASALRSSGIEVEIMDDEAKLTWEKFVRLNALACTTSAADKPIGFIRSDLEWRKLLEGCVSDAVKVAAAYGYETTVEKVMKEIDGFPETLGSSMQRDINEGKKPELESIPKSIIWAGKKKRIKCPNIEKLVGIIEERIRNK